MIRNIKRNLKKSRGFTLVELMIVVAIVGILAALAIYGVRKYMANAKTAEAKNSLGQLGKDAASAYNREKMPSAVLAEGGVSAVSNNLCASATAPVPAAVASIAGRKYQSTSAEWDVGSKSAGWQCLKFSMSDPQYYQYNYTAVITANGQADTFSATATGNLDGDAAFSTFTLTGNVINQRVLVSPTIDENLPEE